MLDRLPTPSQRFAQWQYWRQWRLHAALIACFGLFASLVLNQLMLNLGGVVPVGPLNDYHLFTWNYWWIDYALTHLHVSPYFTNFLLFPHQHNLALHTLTPILYPPYRLLVPLLGDPATLNVILWGSFVMTGYVTCLWLWQQSKSLTFGLLGGLLFAFLPAMLDHAINFHANMWLMGWFAGLLLVWGQVARTRQLRWALVCGIGFWGLWLTDLQFLVWMPWVLIPYGALTLIEAKGHRWRIIGLGLVAVAVMFALTLLAPLPALLRGQDGVTSPARYLTAQAYSIPLSAYFLMPPPTIDDRSIGRLVIILSVVAAVFGKRHPRLRWFWLAVSLPPLILALGPTVTLGSIEIAMPYRWLHDALQGLYRFPSRFAPIGVLALLTFIGMSFEWSNLFHRSRTLPRQQRQLPVIVGAVLLLIIDGRWLAPFPTQAPLPDYAVYHTIGADPADYVLLDVPVTVHSGWAQVGGDQGQRAMWYQRIHHKRQVNGSLSRIPDVEPLYYQQSPLLGWFAGSSPPQVAIARAELATLVKSWPIGYVMVHLGWLDPAASLPILGFLNTDPTLCVVTQERDLVVYRARSLGCPDPFTALDLQFGRQGDEAYLVDGWYPRENIGGVDGRWTRREVTMRLPLQPQHRYKLTFRALAFGSNRLVSLRFGDDLLATIPLAEAWSTYTIDLPRGSFADEAIPLLIPLLTLSANGEQTPAGADLRALSVAYQWLKVDLVGD